MGGREKRKKEKEGKTKNPLKKKMISLKVNLNLKNLLPRISRMLMILLMRQKKIVKPRDIQIKEEKKKDLREGRTRRKRLGIEKREIKKGLVRKQIKVRRKGKENQTKRVKQNLLKIRKMMLGKVKSKLKRNQERNWRKKRGYKERKKKKKGSESVKKRDGREKRKKEKEGKTKNPLTKKMISLKVNLN